ncbi:MAG: hypothetical protein UX85_C0002G0032 [Candidatus Beckwithbacteria bacterium GW2011_GWB1_47_15]|uniref:Uncharacterized protein n=1 Tax=Candidatus Beckwithbacteria bacterium GW2011_GWB1_47_15 TaxID=1618371 RepID=A0A0G1RWZ5_9BACT|nr:MAG: hypothetical protein UY43_C0001G0620 [Candidatus Beckwithbacteria bacterium GW2011_GWC1_49_16]KKU35598.1 MAG: hypothetical protein UX50_C0002G0025 [Candidatus Beckwithbacteria bacterium GW2011_GWA1_46_30]KKU61652.1 MAG: hypothetical protein UX85_C0002G0032 [Candidatus Beckwithbacteria bacterium GW2011_GWB1_47_15]KKU72155.1 MAG: hypothetical protein UX97_C0001G0025 [Candidatus Beckwithbacteria bacterium GW2011_GWA2_47_25]KKW04780.1 MAG: hypothetical protein UY37_C0002G0033 [Candidatus Be
MGEKERQNWLGRLQGKRALRNVATSLENRIVPDLGKPVELISPSGDARIVYESLTKDSPAQLSYQVKSPFVESNVWIPHSSLVFEGRRKLAIKAIPEEGAYVLTDIIYHQNTQTLFKPGIYDSAESGTQEKRAELIELGFRRENDLPRVIDFSQTASGFLSAVKSGRVEAPELVAAT